MPLALLGALALSVAFTQAAVAGTVSMEVDAAGTGTVRFVAGAGEANRVVITLSSEPYGVVITDSGAPVLAGQRCTSLSAYTVRCDRPPEGGLAVYPDVILGDRDDKLASRSGFGFRGYGGPGNDRLLGSPETDVLDGGGGRDQLYGGGSQDFLTDGDLDGMAGNAAPGSDILDGGRGPNDTVSYDQRSVPVNVDIRDPGPDGAVGEADTVRGIEHVTGGSGSDRLAGDDRANDIKGGGGADRLIGRGGNDSFYGHLGLGARFIPDEGADSFSCGLGRDLIYPVEAYDFVQRDCERVGRDDERFDFYFRPYPIRTQGTRAIFKIGCPYDLDGVYDYPTTCHGQLKLIEATGPGRLLGRGTIASGDYERSVPVRLTDTGMRLARRKQGVLAVVQVRGRNLGRTAWTIRLKLRR